MDDSWDFYFCRVDDAPASIFLNLGFKSVLSGLPEDTLYAVQIQMADPGEHGMGSAAEAELLYPLEDALAKAAAAIALRHIARLRNNGYWQVTFMGPSGQQAELRRIADQHLSRLQRSFELVAKEDLNWAYYRDFLYPDDERMQWIKDRHVVEVLEREGDPLTARRRVDHWIYFANEKSRDTFADIVLAQGFSLVSAPKKDAEKRPFLQVHRVDSVELEAIHDVTRFLSELAAQHQAEYDGWETSVEKPS
jgi:regulator of RNase E activity RraB